ncbi:TetR/AcrR family transcriptional regulator [Actinomadura sp. WMMB 499]|uniref:TetR/AcrR family transcriptional regulator n=1 Tax=Actinomadura sp. WMMB 499 TaxID=1219491 RepID=UPI00124437A5|nr:TetR/AcrR family transcriptional regulator [Actinomadura sp. WMMB 499]QFG21132.1 TetR/AcrR family transcriptional regulator [Actinomadura sp. WMMB 499]
MTLEPGWADRLERNATARPRPGTFVGPRAKLVTAGHRLLLERGDSSYTIEELVRVAGVAIKTFYRCFANKEEFLRTVFTSIVTESTPRIREHVMTTTDDPLERLRLAVARPLDWHRENEQLSRVIAHEHVRIAATSPETIAATGRTYEALMRDLIVDAAEAGLVSPADLDWDVHIITSTVTNSFLSLIIGMAEPPDRRLLADNVWRFCLTALRAPDTVLARPRPPLEPAPSLDGDRVDG